MVSQHKSEGYNLLPRDDDADYEQPEPNRTRYADHQPFTFLTQYIWRFTVVVAFISLILASFCFGYQLRATGGLSPYLKLAYSEPDILWWNTEYSGQGSSDAEINRLWDTSIPWESGIIALTNKEVEDMNLPESQPFPWDSKKKRIYIVNSHHLLHCVRNVYISIQQYRTNKTQTIQYEHILHCLDSLRVEIMCTADDTLRYVPLNSAHEFRPGDGQQRKCRDWNQVQNFVEAHDPCYRYLEPGNSEISNLERFKFCPPGSIYLPKIRQHLGYQDDWVPESREGPRELEW
ncbi:hypothetical protein F4810DRAFT_669144 [Camillea tinctor]|nr:hypothetical protein F4810DRAFT_669144 [Camillea tinctor]